MVPRSLIVLLMDGVVVKINYYPFRWGPLELPQRPLELPPQTPL